MKRGAFFLLLLFIFPLVLAQQNITKTENYNDYASLRMDFSLHSQIHLIPTDASPQISNVEADLFFYPRPSSIQKIFDLTPTSNAPALIEVTDESIHYTWTKPSLNLQPLTYDVHAQVATENVVARVQHPVEFPIRILPDDLLVYTKATEKIDLTPDIEVRARALVGTKTEDRKSVV